MKTNFIFVCDNAQITETASTLDARGIFDSINASGFPAMHPKIDIVLNVEIPPAEQNILHRERFEISQGDQPIGSGDLQFTPTNRRHQFIHHVQNIILPAEGQCDVRVFIDGTLVAKTYFMAKTAS